MKVGIIGLGYVGLPLAVAFAEAGHEVVGLDADQRKIDALAEGRSYIGDTSEDSLAAAGERGAEVAYHDPYVPALGELGLESVPLDEEAAAADVVAIVTAHPGVDWERLVEESALVIDFRGVTREITADNLVRL